ncbi:MAG: ABC transporter substrate-binding protein [Planctomycetota bacterium]
MTLVRRLAIVIAVGFLVLLGMQISLTRDDTPGVRFVLTASPEGADAWTFTSNAVGNTYLGRTPATVTDVMARLHEAQVPVTLTAHDGAGTDLWRATVEPDGTVRFDGDDPPADLAGLADRLTRDVCPTDFTPTREVTIAEVLAAKLPTPTLSRVSFPAFSFEQAFPGDSYRKLFTDPHAEPGNEVLHIDRFVEAPMLTDLDSMSATWRKHYPQSLPPVAERLPRNPAVVRGPDGVGRYGGTWHRCTGIWSDLNRKIGYESFVRFDPSGRISPCLAYKWEVEDNRIYTFYLRKGHRWSDGQPFTAQDVVWVCNTLIGSDVRASRPNWMQETDGRSRLYVDDVLDWSGLVDAILREADSDAPSPGRQLARVGGKKLLGLLAEARDGDDSPELRYQIVTTLNMVFREKAFFDVEAFAHLDLEPEIAELEAKGFSRLDDDEHLRLNWLLERRSAYGRAVADVDELRPIALSRLNLALFREAYRDDVDIARLRYVKVEAVEDAHGDDSHIVRFTFPKPNAIFLEKTATFMFYLGIFGNAKHFTAPYHPEGSSVLNTIDVYHWEDLFARLRAEAGSDRPSVGRRLWERLPEDLRRDLIARPPSDEDSEQRKQRIVDAINAALRSPDFYTSEAWADVDLVSELDGLRTVPYDELRMNKQDHLRFDDLRRRADLLRRHDQGDPTLTDEARFELNLMLLRAAYSTGGKPMMAANRIDALTTRAQNHPGRYSTWANLFYAMGRYDPVTNPHPPTLRAWRIITEPTEGVIVAVRNPYYYRVDTAGNQLPYIDAIETLLETRPSVILLKMASGNVDFQVREIAFEHFGYLKAHEDQGDYEIRLWANDYCGEVTFGPLQPRSDPQYARLQETPTFRHALSLAINRQEIIDVVYGGVGTPAQWCVPEGSPYYCPEHAKVSVEYDPRRANAMLDALGLDQRRSDGTRLLWDGSPLIMNVETEEARPLAVVQMVCDYWRELGIDTRMQVRTYAMLNRLSQLGDLDIRVHKEGGNFFGPIIAGGYAPTHPAEAVQWYGWATYIRSGGRGGDIPPDRIMDIQRMWEEVITAPTEQAKYDAWQRLSRRTARELPIMAIMTSPGKLVYVRNNFKNVPDLSLAGWAAHDPGNACPESFFFDPPQE